MINRFLIVLLIFAFGERTFASEKDTIPAYIGISYVPSLNWKIKFMDEKTFGKPLTLNFNLSSMATNEGNFGIRRIGISSKTKMTLMLKILRG